MATHERPETITETADTDARSPREYHTRRCNGDRPMSWVAEPRRPVRRPHTVDHRTRRRLQERNRLGDGVDAIGGMTGKPDAPEQPPHRALRPDRQMLRPRQGQARLH